MRQTVLQKSCHSNSTGKSKQRKGFTLAEVLITLTIIGVVAALTIPPLVQKTQDQQYTDALKKNYAEMTQATIQMQYTSNKVDIPSTVDPDGVRTAFGSAMKFVKTDTALNIWGEVGFGNAASKYRNYKGTAPAYMHLFNDKPAALLTNGAFLGFTSPYRITYGFHEIYIDTNGKKGPNMMGMDVGKFLLISQPDNSYKLLPVGSIDAKWGPMSNCAANSTSYGTSWPCTALRITNPDSMP